MKRKGQARRGTVMEFEALCVRQSRSQLQNRDRTDPSLIDECRHELVFPF